MTRPRVLMAVLPLMARAEARAPRVRLTDFSLADGAVPELKGVAYSPAPGLTISDLSPETAAS